MTDDELAALERQLGELAIIVDRLDRQRTEQATEIARLHRSQGVLADEQLALAARAAGSGNRPDQAPPNSPVVEWMTVEDPERAVHALTDLRSWVQRVWAMYDPIVDCWPWHPQVVAELLACKRAWAASSAPGAPAVAMADWHGRWRTTTHRAVAGRLKGCNPTTGHEHAGGRYTVEHVHLPEYAIWWASCHGSPSSPSASPGLTALEH